MRMGYFVLNFLLFNKLNFYLCSDSKLTFNIQCSSVKYTYVLDDGKSKTCSACFLGARFIYSIKTLTQTRQMLFCNTDSCIGDLKVCGIFTFRKTYRYASAVFVVIYGVGADVFNKFIPYMYFCPPKILRQRKYTDWHGEDWSLHGPTVQEWKTVLPYSRPRPCSVLLQSLSRHSLR